MSGASIPTVFFPKEGKQNMEECIRVAFEWCAATNVRKAVIFTGTGEGPFFAARELLTQPAFSNIRLVAVTPPAGRPYKADPSDPSSPLVKAGVSAEMKELLRGFGVPVLSANLPFKERHGGRGPRDSEWVRVEESLGVFGGGLPLCLQAVMLACDAGEVEMGESVVAMTSDTAISAVASRTETFLSPWEGLLVDHIICRPAVLNISKNKHGIVAERSNPSPVQESLTLSKPEDESK